MEITYNEFLNVLNQVETPTFVHIVMETPVRMKKTNNPYFNKVMKLTSGNYLIGTDYGKRVNKIWKKKIRKLILLLKHQKEKDTYRNVF